jgi:hypothetical protein
MELKGIPCNRKRKEVSLMKTELSIPSLEQIVNFFKEETIDQIAKEISFSQRIRKLSAIVFLGLFTGR